MSRKTITGILITLLISSTYLSFFYYKVLLKPNSYLFTENGDGLKTYYHLLYYSKHDTQPLQLNGIAYPFGENQLFEDSLPFLSNALSLLSKVWPGILDHQVAILNLIVLFSIVLGAIFIFLILKCFGVPQFWAILFGTGIAFLSSQVKLLNPPGHFGLSMVCFFPMGWYFLIKWIQKPTSLFWSGLIAANILLWNFFHVYLGLSLLMFNFGVYFFLKLFKHPSLQLLKKSGSHILIQFILPIAFIFTLVFTIDSHPDRINLPFVSNHRATWKMVFISEASPFKSIYSLFVQSLSQPNLSWSNYGNYIGLVANLFIITGLITTFKPAITRKVQNVLTFFSKPEWSFAFSSILVLLFSFAIPMIYFPPPLQNSIPFIKQFSSVGRFAWVFFYVITVLSVIYFYRILKRKNIRIIVLSILLSILIIETYPIHKNISNKIDKSPNTFLAEYLTGPYQNLNLPDTATFQVILPLPAYFKFNIPIALNLLSDSSIYGSMVASVHTGLPIMSTYLSRPSVSESIQIFQMLLPLPYYKSIKGQQLLKKDFAVLVHKTDLPKFNSYEKQLLENSTCFDSSGNFYWYRLPYSYFDSLNLISDSMNQSQIHKEYFDDSCLFYLSFDSINAPKQYLGNGAYVGNKKVINHVFKIPTASFDTSKTYSLRFWYYNYIWDQTFTTAILIERDSTNQIIKSEYYSPLTAQFIDNWWYLSEHPFKISSQNNSIELQFSGSDKFKEWFVLDEITIVPK